MGPRLPQRVFYTLSELERVWEIDTAELRHWLIHGDLSAHAWMPVMSVYQMQEHVEGSSVAISRQLRHWEGYSSISRYHCHRIFRRGYICLREFICSSSNELFYLPDMAEDIIVSSDDLMILREEKGRFEKAHGITPRAGSATEYPGRHRLHHRALPDVTFDPAFKCVNLEGQNHHFGDTQAAVLRLLYEAANAGQPWQHGKYLLKQAGSQSFSLSNIFKHKPVWRQLIQSNKRGRYRLSDNLFK